MKKLSNFLTSVPEVKMLALPEVMDLRVIKVNESYRVFDFNYLKSVTPPKFQEIFSSHNSLSNLTEWSESELVNILESGMRVSKEYNSFNEIYLDKVNPYEVNYYLNLLDEVDVNPEGALVSGVIKESDSNSLTENMSYFIFDPSSEFLTNSLESHSDKELLNRIPMTGYSHSGIDCRKAHRIWVNDSWTQKEYRNQIVIDPVSLTELYSSYGEMRRDIRNLSVIMNKAIDCELK
jgi:hypothetical protein